MRMGVWIGPALLFLGCQNPSEPLPYPLKVTEDALGPIHLKEPFDIGVLRGKLPGFELEKLSEVAAGNGQTLLRLKRGESVIALLLKDRQNDRVGQILILSPLVKNAQGLGIDDPLPLSERLNCVNDECRYTNEPAITYRVIPNTHTIREIVLQSL